MHPTARVRPTVCLNMIVKDEAPVIRRCLDSVRPHIDHWVIVDTGSTDGTQEIIRSHLGGIPGELHERPWRDFGHNRSEAIALARGKAGYILTMDADNVFHAPQGWAWPALDADAYLLALRSAGSEYRQCLLVSDRLQWRWVGVVHEYLESTPAHRAVPLDGPWIDRRHEGARSRDPETFRKDAAALERALAIEPGNARNAFYLAQSWRDAGELAKAREAYLRRAGMGGWEEERWCALYEAARLAERLGAPLAEVRSAYLEAWQARPARAEPLVELARLHRERGEWALAHLFARQAAAIPRPADILFVDAAAYAWRALDELGAAAWYVGAIDEGRAALERALASGSVPAGERARLEANLAFYRPAG